MVAAAVDVGCAGLGAAREQLHAAGLDVLGAADAAVVGADEGREPGVVAQPGEPERDVGRGAADVLGGLAVRGVHDVDEQLADDERPALTAALGVRRIRGGRGSGGHLVLSSMTSGLRSTLSPGRLGVPGARRRRYGGDDARTPPEPLLHGVRQEPRAVAGRRASAWCWCWCSSSPGSARSAGRRSTSTPPAVDVKAQHRVADRRGRRAFPRAGRTTSARFVRTTDGFSTWHAGLPDAVGHLRRRRADAWTPRRSGSRRRPTAPRRPAPSRPAAAPGQVRARHQGAEQPGRRPADAPGELTTLDHGHGELRGDGAVRRRTSSRSRPDAGAGCRSVARR